MDHYYVLLFYYNVAVLCSLLNSGTLYAGPYCGRYSTELSIHIPESMAHVRFKTDGSVVDTGFVAHYTAVTDFRTSTTTTSSVGMCVIKCGVVGVVI